MNRKRFIIEALQCGLAAGTAAVFPCSTGSAQTAGEDRQIMEKKFKEAWISTLMRAMEEQLGEQVRSQLMESCGRACARRSSVMKTAQSCEGDVGRLVKTLAGFLGEGTTLKGNIVQLKYPKCYCELVADGPARLPDVYCHCSEGWVKEMFEAAAQKKVQVETLQTIKRGADSCRFRITI
jgi:predicted hydrocarbon binding protein